jgi:hypothetical protein
MLIKCFIVRFCYIDDCVVRAFETYSACGIELNLVERSGSEVGSPLTGGAASLAVKHAGIEP